HAESEEERYVGSMLLEPRSLFLMTDDAYENLLHGIKEVTEDVIDEKVFNGEEHRGKTLTFFHNPPRPCRVQAERIPEKWLKLPDGMLPDHLLTCYTALFEHH
ncbi:hypothetical protein ANCDUO_24863, partial [Ancylostoma duodenale]